MKRWRVTHTHTGEVLEINLGLQQFVGTRYSALSKSRTDPNRHFVDAVDEIGALAAFLQAWKEQDNG